MVTLAVHIKWVVTMVTGLHERLVCSVCQVKGGVEKINSCFICVDGDFQIIFGEN